MYFCFPNGSFLYGYLKYIAITVTRHASFLDRDLEKRKDGIHEKLWPTPRSASSLLLSSHNLDGKRNNPYRERVLFEESDMPHIHEVATLTSKGQITLPKSIRQTLDPGLDEYRQGNTIGRDYRHWRRAKIWRRFRLFFRYDSRTRVIVCAWVNDGQTMRSADSKSDPYAVFRKMLERGRPPDDWAALFTANQSDWP